MASLASFVSRMPKHVDNVDLTPGAGVKLMLLICVQEEASLSLIATVITGAAGTGANDLVKAVQRL